MKEKVFLEIGEVSQGMFLESEDTSAPVLLFLHGGPGSPEIAFNDKYPSGLEKIFTVCWWEQRGSGISFSSKLKPEQMSIEYLIADTIEVTKYLKTRFNKEKIYIMGHSWGSLLGVLTVERAPELFYAYIGTGQVVRQKESEMLAYTYMLNEFEKLGNTKMVSKLKKMPIDSGYEIGPAYLNLRSQAMAQLGIGIMRSSRSMSEVAMMVLKFKGYTLKEKIGFIRGGAFSNKCLWDFVMKTNLTKEVLELKIPVYILQGRYDYQVSYVIAKEFADKLDAPIKGFYTFENSAHSPCFEESEKMQKIFKSDVLKLETNLADRV